MNKKTSIMAISIVLIDQLLKALVNTYMDIFQSKSIINNFFYITNLHNDGIAWGYFSNRLYIIIFLSVIALFIIYRYITTFKNNLRNIFAFGLITGGIYGNLLDRIFFGYVRDFLDFRIFGYDYPVFNISDIALVVGVGLLIISIFKGDDLSDNKSRSRKNKIR